MPIASEHANAPKLCHFKSYAFGVFPSPVVVDCDDIRPVSSLNSRLAASNVPSRDSIFPPGMDHCPLFGSFPLCTRSHRGDDVLSEEVFEVSHLTTTATAARGIISDIDVVDDREVDAVVKQRRRGLSPTLNHEKDIDVDSVSSNATNESRAWQKAGDDIDLQKKPIVFILFSCGF